MGLKLLILGWWTPKYIMRKELKNLSDKSITTLEELLSKHVIKEFNDKNQKPAASIQKQRTIMAQTQAKLVESLVAAIGREETIRLGREALFLVGQDIGKQTRLKLGLKYNPKDLTRAAKILYRVLGIDFHLQWRDSSNATAIIDRCPLAENYSKLTCEVLSATDEGVIKGLQPNATMKFKKYMTNGCKNCRADIHFNEMETVQ